MADSSITRMNLSAIKKVDPYAKDIVDSSSHVAFYTFNSEQNEWEKTDVEGAFFIYNRNAEPFHSIFINNRLNTTSFVEPITGQLELQSQPPFLLYRNERSRIRGFWFYNSDECDRISHLVTLILQKKGNGLISQDLIISSSNPKSQNTNIFNMLSKAQQDYNLQKAVEPNRKSTPSNVLQFFESAKQSSSEPIIKRVLPLSVDQIEKLQQVSLPSDILNNAIPTELRLSPKTKPNPPGVGDVLTTFPPLGECHSFSRMGMQAPLASELSVKDSESELCLRRLFFEQFRSKAEGNEEPKPALMPPTMFDNSGIKQDSSVLNISSNRQRLNPLQPLDSTQFLQALSYLMHNDKEFVKKLHDAYLKSFSKLVFDNNATYQ